MSRNEYSPTTTWKEGLVSGSSFLEVKQGKSHHMLNVSASSKFLAWNLRRGGKDLIRGVCERHSVRHSHTRKQIEFFFSISRWQCA
jgi:hypothetical protein